MNIAQAVGRACTFTLGAKVSHVVENEGPLRSKALFASESETPLCFVGHHVRVGAESCFSEVEKRFEAPVTASLIELGVEKHLVSMDVLDHVWHIRNEEVAAVDEDSIDELGNVTRVADKMSRIKQRCIHHKSFGLEFSGK